MQLIALMLIVVFIFVWHWYLSLVAVAVASLANLTISQWCFASIVSSFFVIAGIILSADEKELIINAPDTKAFSQERVEESADSSTESGMLASTWARTVQFMTCIFLSFVAVFDGGTILFLCVFHNAAIWLVVGTFSVWFNFEIALVSALPISIGITFLTRKVRKVGS